MLTAGALGLIVGVGLWYVAAGLLPRSAGDWIAASLIGGSKWQAGETLMQESQPGDLGQDGAALRRVRRAGDRAVRGGDRRADPSARARGRKECIRAGPPSHPLPRGRRVGEQGQ